MIASAQEPDQLWDVAVIGAGPAGSLAAYCAARSGLRVLLLEKSAFPRYKVCGCCINGAALACLKTAGLGHLPAVLHAPRLTGYALASNGRSATLRLPAGVAVSRAAFDAAVADAAVAAGAQFRPQCRAVLQEVTTTGAGFTGARTLEIATPHAAEQIQARVVLAAAGLGALTRGIQHLPESSPTLPSGHSHEQPRDTPTAGSYFGAGCILPAAAVPRYYAPGCVYMTCGEQGYLGWVRLEDDRVNFAAALDPTRVQQSGGVAGCLAELLATALPHAWPAPFAPIEPDELAGGHSPRWHGTPLLTRESELLAADRLFVLGDQAGYVEPFTGEGIAWALESALRVTPFVVAACAAARAGNRTWNPQWTAAWAQTQQIWRAPRQRLCRWVSRSLRHPLLTHAAVRILGGLPRLANPLIEQLNAAPASLAMTGARI